MREINTGKLFDMALQDRGLNEVIMSLKTGRNADQCFDLTGPSEEMKAFIWACLSVKSDKSTAVMLSDELKTRAAQDLLSDLAPGVIHVFRQREYSLIEADTSSREEEFARLAMLHSVLSAEKGIFLFTAGGALSRLMSPEKFRGLSIRVSTGTLMSPQQLSTGLLACGYERASTTDVPGLFAGRGDIIDVVLPGEILKPQTERSGIRISFFGDEIDAVKRFSLDTQRTVEMLDETVIYPAREVIIQPDEVQSVLAAIKACPSGRAGEILKHDCERIEEGISFPGTDRYIHLIYPQAASILDYIREGGAILVLDELRRIRERMDSRLADFYEGYRNLLEQEKIMPCSEGIMYKPHEILKQAGSFRPLLHFSFMSSSDNGIPGARRITLTGRDCPVWKGRQDRLAADLAEYIRRGIRPVIASDNAERERKISAILSEKGIFPEIVRLPLKAGFEYPAAGFVLIGESYIFGSSKRTSGRQRGKGIGIDLFSDLKPGEPVVHEVHGIGRYCGLRKVESGGAVRDYLKIEYLGGDSLYISTDNLDQIQKYVGSEGRQPKLSKLGGQEWTRQKEKARSSIRSLATDLVRLYAERMALKGFAFSPDTVWQQEFEDSFSYELTSDQERSTQEIKTDMESDKVMDRLLCGDVGFGKTEVAFRALFKCVMDGRQAAILVPTTVLATQHYETLTGRLKDFPVRAGLLSRFSADATIRDVKKHLADGTLEIVIGTHMILSEGVRFKDLGLLIIDEEQRFGVDHKEKLKEMFPAVDVLTLTATPIPRTLHMSMSGIRDISVLEEPPPDRRAVQTYVMEYDKELVSEAMLREISRKGQVFYLFNNTSRIAEKAEEIKKMLPGARVAVAHGKMRERALEQIIEEFIRDEYDILVCTTIIESGIDMPNVNTIIVENAEKFGLSQLYQLKGRVGRSGRQAYAYITYKHDKVLTEIAEKRLAAIRDFTELGSGFKIALRDLEVRGAGSLLGAEQHGHLDSIGYDLYCRMLEEEIALQAGKPVQQRFEAVIEIRIDAYIPAAYVSDEAERMDMYRKIANISDKAAFMDVIDEIEDRYGQAPDNVITLCRISYIRNAAGKAGFSHVTTKGGATVLTYREAFVPDMQGLSSVLNDPSYKGKVLYNAGTKPYLVLRGTGVLPEKVPEHLFDLLGLLAGDKAQERINEAV